MNTEQLRKELEFLKCPGFQLEKREALEDILEALPELLDELEKLKGQVERLSNAYLESQAEIQYYLIVTKREGFYEFWENGLPEDKAFARRISMPSAQNDLEKILEGA